MSSVPQAQQELLKAVQGVAAVRGLREGLRLNIEFVQSRVDPSNPDHFEALDLLPVWVALDALVEAVEEARDA